MAISSRCRQNEGDVVFAQQLEKFGIRNSMPNFHGVAQWARDIDLKKARAFISVVSLARKSSLLGIARQELKEIGEFLSVPMKLRRNCQRIGPSFSRNASTPDAKKLASGVFTSRKRFNVGDVTRGF